MRNRRKTFFTLFLTIVCLIFVFGNLNSQESAAEYFEKAFYYEDVQGDLQKAIELYEKALDLEPKNPYACSGKADCLRGMRRYPSAIKLWEIALENGMDKKIGLTRIGDSYISLNDFERAEVSYRKAMAIGYDKSACHEGSPS